MNQTDEIHDFERAMYETLILGKPPIKVAMLIVHACGGGAFPDDEIADAALECLVLREDVQSFGIIQRWRHSEKNAASD